MNPVIELLQSHRSIRKFKPEPVAEEMIRSIVAAGQCASTSNFVQAYTIIRVKDPAVRKQIAELAGPQPWVEACPLFLVFCADLNRSELACRMNDREMVQGYTEQFIIATVDVALAAQNTMIAAESLGLGGVYIGGIRNNPQKICDLLRIPDHVYPVFGMCLGYPNDDPKRKPRLPLEAVLKTDRYTDGEDAARISAYDQVCREYYNKRDGSARDDTWTRQISEMMGKVQRPHMKGFVQGKGFDLK